MKRDWKMAREKVEAEGQCRFCRILNGCGVVDPHHVVPRSLGGDEDPRNIIALCRSDHDLAHAKGIDLLPLLDLEEQSYAVSLIGIERAHRLLAPSLWRKTSARRGTAADLYPHHIGTVGEDEFVR